MTRSRAIYGRRRVALAALLLLLVPTIALAHQYLLGSFPADGERVEVVPDTLRLTFSEPVRLNFTEVVVEGLEGPLGIGPLTTAPEERGVLLVPVIAEWRPGEHTVRWVTVGADGHRTNGEFSFTVAEDADGLPEPEPEALEEVEEDEVTPPPAHVDHHGAAFTHHGFGPDSPAYVAVRWLVSGALIAMIGAVALPLLVVPIARRRRHEEVSRVGGELARRAAGLGFLAAGVLAVAALLRLWAQSATLFGPGAALELDNLSAVLGFQPWGAGWILQLAAAAVALGAFVLARRGSSAGWVVAAIAVVAAAFSPALSGHAVAAPEVAGLAVASHGLHVLAAGGWVGGLFALLVVGLPSARGLEPGRRWRTFSALVHGFSPTALLFAGLLVATGVVSAWVHLAELSTLWTTVYGRTLLLKVGLFGGVFAVGAYNFLRVRPALGEEAAARRLRRSGTAELGIALLVLIVTAVLVALPTPAAVP